MLGAARDCEAITSGVLGQPVNAVSTIAFLVAGVWVVRRGSRPRWIGIALIATGLGSFLFHGPMPPGSELAHDVSLAWLLAVIAGHGTKWENWAKLPTALILAVVTFLLPGVADPFAVLLSILAVGSVLWRDRSWATIGPLLMAGIAGIYGRLGATGGPLCNPSSLWQPHAVWHVLAAVAVGWLAESSNPQNAI